MTRSTITVQGNLCADPVQRTAKDGTTVYTTMRLASTPRRLDRATGALVDEPTSYYNVTCFRRMARNAAYSLHKGDPVVVSGTLSVTAWESGDKSGTSADIVASVVGHDLTFGISAFTRNPRPLTGDAARETPDEGGSSPENGDVEDVFAAAAPTGAEGEGEQGAGEPPF